MTRQDLIVLLSERSPFFLSDDASVAVNLILETVIKALDEGQRVEIRGFGSFSMASRAERIARNPQTGEKVMIPAKKTPHFKPGKDLRDMILPGLGQTIKK